MTSSYSGTSPINVDNLDQTQLGKSLIQQGIYGGELTLKDYRRLASMGHQEQPLKEVVENAMLNGLAIDPHLKNFLQQNLTVADITDPVKSQSAFDKMSIAADKGVIREEGGPIYKEGYGFTPMPGQTITFQRADGSRYDVTGETPGEAGNDAGAGAGNPFAGMAESLMSGFSGLMAQMARDNAAAAERARQANLTMQRNQRSASQMPNMQIQGAGSTPNTAGTQGFRRRADQFTPVYKGLGGFGATAQNNKNMAQFSINT
jgi:hypothetical protein|tara:strand:+ start:50 stop:832 length:783 start_codon:yes stop_codon:yes gene_type:complete